VGGAELVSGMDDDVSVIGLVLVWCAVVGIVKGMWVVSRSWSEMR
jgi:hypothetical protein